MTNTSTSRTRDFWSIGRKVLTTIAMASAVMTLSVPPALADRDGNHGRGDRHDRHGRHGQQHWRGDHGGYRDGYRDSYRYQPTYRQSYYYAQPVYVPPPVYYEPQRSPGVSLFFPLDLRR